MKVGELLITLLIANVVLISIGNFYYNGGVNYGVENLTDISVISNEETFYSNMSSGESELGLGNIEESSEGSYLTSVADVALSFFTGGYVSMWENFVTNVLPLGGIPIPDWLVSFILYSISITFVLAVVSFFWKRITGGFGG